MRQSLPRLLLCILALGLVSLGAFGAEEAAPTSPPPEAQAAPSAAPLAAPSSLSAEPTLVPATTPTLPAAAAPAPVPPPLVGIDVVGNQQVAIQDILAAVTSKVGGPYVEEQAARDRQAIINLGWFATVAMDRETVPNGVRLVFRVTENPVVRDIQFRGIEELTRDQLLAAMQTKPGSVYNTYRLAQDAQAIEELYRTKGYILAQVIGTERITQEGVLTLVIAEGVIEEVKITGNSYTKIYVIRRYIRTRPGEVFNEKRVTQDVVRLSNTGYFDTVRRDAEVGTEPGKVILVITVVEKERTGMINVGGAYASVQGLFGYIDLTKSNLRGSGQMVSLRTEFGGRRSYEFGYRNPWIMTPETSLSLGLYNRLIVREAFVSAPGGTHTTVLYDERRTGGNLVLGRPVSDHTTVYVGLRRDDVSITGLSESEQFLLAGAAFLPREVRSLTLTSVTDTRDNLYNPRAGAYYQFSFEFAGLFGGADFKKYATDVRRYLRVGKRNVLAFRLVTGLTTGEAPYLEQFLIGGSDSLRGFRVDRFAGSHMAVLNTEYRFPLSGNLTGVTFVDVGDAWGGVIATDPFFRGDKSFQAHVGYGAGVRVLTALGPLRLDLGFSKEGTETHFGFSHMF